jgi:hypothetical protein
MCSNEHLWYVTGGRIYVTYGSRDRSPESPKTQPRARTAASIRPFAPCRRTIGEGVWCFSSSSLSLSAAGPSFEATSSHRRHQGRFHCEALPRVGTTSALVREHHWSIAKRNRQPSVAGDPEAEKRAWLSELHRTATLFSWNIDSIVCLSGNSSKSTNCWCPRDVGRLDP